MAKFCSGLKSLPVILYAWSGAMFIPSVAFATSPDIASLTRHTGSLDGNSMSNFRWHYNNGVKAFENGDIFKAKIIFSDLLRSGGADGNDARLNFYMARIKAIQGDNKGAIRHYNIVLRQYPRTYSIMAGMGQSYVKLGDKERARRVLSRLEVAAKVCAGSCENTETIDASIAIVENALAVNL